MCVFFFKLYAFILLTSTLVPGINYFVVTTHLVVVFVRKNHLRTLEGCKNSFLCFRENKPTS